MSHSKPTYEELEKRLKELESQNKVFLTKIKALEERDNHFSTFMEQLPGAAYIKDEKDRIIYCNHCFAALTKNKPEDLIGKTTNEYVPQDLTDKFEKENEQVRHEGVVLESEHSFHGKSGVSYWLTRKFPLNHENGKTFLGSISINITRRKQIEFELQRSRDFLSTIYNNSQIAFFIVKVHKPGHYTYEGINETHEKHFGISNNDIIGKTPDDLKPVLGKKTVDYLYDIYNTCVSAKDVFESEYELPDNWNNQWWLSRLNPLIDENGNVFRIIGTAINITDRKRAEESLLESEQKYRKLFDNMEQGVFYQLSNGQLIDCNPALLGIFGMSRDEFLSRTSMDTSWKVIDEQGAEIPGSKHPSMKALLTGKPVRNEISGVFNPQKNEYIWLSITAIPEFKKNENKPFRVIVTLHDISELKKAEAALRKNEEKMRSIFRIAPTGIGLVKNRVLTEVNPRVCEMTGYSKKELTGKNARCLYPTQADYEFVGNEKYRQIAEHGTGVVETRWKTKNGVIIDVLLASTPVDLNNLSKGVTFTALDITERKKAEQALRESEHQKEIILNSSAEMIAYYDTDLRVIWANKASAESVGMTNEELSGKHCYEIWQKRKSPCPDCPVLKAKKHKKPFKGEQKTPDGKYWYLRGYPVMDNKNNVVALVEFGQDITERKQMENELKNKNEEYQSVNEELRESLAQIQKMNTALETAKKKAEESERLKSAFLANMSHEIRTPMNGIIGFSEMYLKSGLSDKKRNFIAKIVIDSGKQLLNLINDILDISKIETGDITITTEEMNLNDLIMELYAFFKPQSANKSLKLIPYKNLPDDESEIWADTFRLKQVLVNLLNNAFKFTHEGYIKFGYEYNENTLKFFVEDTGIGIADDRLESIFERFRQAETTTSRMYGGTGLGLSISQKLVELMGGKINVESEKNKGSVFRFTIAYQPVHEKEKSTSNEKIIRTENIFTILVVEDEEVNYLYIEEILPEKDVSLILSRDGKEAVEICKNNPAIDLVLMDIKLPVMNGYDATRAIKKIRPTLPVIAQTAYVLPGDKEKALDAGCDGYLPKPLDADELYTIVDKYKNR
jgi:PAS domain S-box-containing protein